MRTLALGLNALGSIFWMLLYFDKWSARHYLWQWLISPDLTVKGLGFFVVLCLLTPPATVWWLWNRGGNRQDEDFFAPDQWDNTFAETYERRGSNLLLKLVLVGVLVLAILVFAVTRPQAQQAATSPPSVSLSPPIPVPTTEAPIAPPPSTNSHSDPSDCDPNLVWEIYDPGWVKSQDPHMGQAIDVGAGSGKVIHSPICGWVKHNGMGGHENANTMLVIDNSLYSITMYHGVFDSSLQVGSAVALGQAIGTESNIGWTYKTIINDLGEEEMEYCGAGSSCGYHTHISIWDARISAEVDISTIWLPRGVLYIPTPHPPIPSAPDPPQETPADLSNFSPNVTRWVEPLSKWANHYGVSLRDASTIMTIESGGNHEAESRSGAIGLMQIMAQYHSERLQPGESLWTPEVNIRVGLEYFSEHMVKWPGQPAAWYAAYNGGGMAGDWYAGLATREQYVTYLNGLGYNGEAKAQQVETYVSRAMALR